LADRAIFLTLGPIGEEWRRSETELCRDFELARPQILGALLDAAAHGLAALDRVHLNLLPRMADFALWATACETALWPAGTFARAYAANQRASIERIIDADPVATCVRDLMTEHNLWTGSAADLLRVSLDRSSDRISRSNAGWPICRWSICSLLSAGSAPAQTHRFIAKGLLVRALISPAVLVISSALLLAPKQPRPAALETAATSSTDDRPLPNGPCKIG
jgi:hypothetical protein